MHIKTINTEPGSKLPLTTDLTQLSSVCRRVRPRSHEQSSLIICDDSSFLVIVQRDLMLINES